MPPPAKRNNFLTLQSERYGNFSIWHSRFPHHNA